MNHVLLQEYREQELSDFPKAPGVYVLRDWFKAPLYVGATVDGLVARVRRHLTSARSDLIASGKICVSEIAYIDAYEITDPSLIRRCEKHLIFMHNSHRPIFNSKVPSALLEVELPPMREFQMLPTAEIEMMRTNPILVMQHHSRMLNKIIDYTRTAKDNNDTRQSIEIRRSLLNYHAENFEHADAHI